MLVSAHIPIPRLLDLTIVKKNECYSRNTFLKRPSLLLEKQ